MVSLFLYPENRKDIGFLKGFLTFLISFFFFGFLFSLPAVNEHYTKQKSTIIFSF